MSVPRRSQPVAKAEPLLRRRPPAADARVHDHEPADPVGALDREPEADRPAPILDDDGRVAEVELVGEPLDRADVEVVAVVLEPERLVGAAEAEVVGRDRPRRRRQLRDDRAVEVRPRRLAVQEQDGGAVALVEVVHAEPVLVEVVRARTRSRAGTRSARRACGTRRRSSRTSLRGVERSAAGRQGRWPSLRPGSEGSRRRRDRDRPARRAGRRDGRARRVGRRRRW